MIKLSSQQLIGNSQSIKIVRKKIEQVAKSKAPVMIIGESGTGKEICAQEIHQKSSRSQKEFVALNCPLFLKT